LLADRPAILENGRFLRGRGGQQRGGLCLRQRLLALASSQDLTVVVLDADVRLRDARLRIALDGSIAPAVGVRGALTQLEQLAVLGADRVRNQQKMRRLAQRARGKDERYQRGE
jgi:hypothetical protein